MDSVWFVSLILAVTFISNCREEKQYRRKSSSEGHGADSECNPFEELKQHLNMI